MEYQEALSQIEALKTFGIHLGLGRMQALLERLGNPQDCGIQYVHLAGTNGKGSTSAMIEAILRSAGYKTGFFSSPDLHSYRERFRINNQPIPKERFAPLFEQVYGQAQVMVKEGLEAPTEFEISTAMAFEYFYQEEVDWVVLETGLGGSIDSTNVVKNAIAVITSVGIDHMQYLGNTLSEIAAVKSGIIKPNSHVFCGAKREALDVIRHKAKKEQAKLSVLGKDFQVRFRQDFWKDGLPQGQNFDFVAEQKTFKNLQLPLLGRHQIDNAALAVAAVLAIGVSEAAIREGLKQVIWPARLEIFSTKPLVIIDGAHNTDGMRVLSDFIKTYFPRQRKVALLGMLADKEREKALTALLPYLDEVVVARPQNPRAGDWQRLTAIIRQYGLPVTEAEDPVAAIQTALALLQEGDLLLVCGSFYLVGPIRQWLIEQGGEKIAD